MLIPKFASVFFFFRKSDLLDEHELAIFKRIRDSYLICEMMRIFRRIWYLWWTLNIANKILIEHRKWSSSISSSLCSYRSKRAQMEKDNLRRPESWVIFIWLTIHLMYTVYFVRYETSTMKCSWIRILEHVLCDNIALILTSDFIWIFLFYNDDFYCSLFNNTVILWNTQ